MTGIMTILCNKKRYSYRAIDYSITRHIELYEGEALNDNYKLSFGYGCDKLQRLHQKTTGNFSSYLFNTHYYMSRKRAKHSARQRIDEFYDTDYIVIIAKEAKKIDSMSKNYMELIKIVDKYGGNKNV